MTFSALSENEAFARTAVAGFVMSLDPTVEQITDIKTAVSEAVTNCVVHGYPDKKGEILNFDNELYLIWEPTNSAVRDSS